MGNSVVVVVAGDDKTGEVFNAVKKHLDETKSKAKETSDSLGQIGDALRHGLEAAGIAVGLREVANVLKEVVGSAIDTGMELGHLSQQTGISVQNLSVLRYTSQQTGIAFETLTKGFKKLSTDIFEWEHGEKLAGEAFQDLGIKLSDVKAHGNDMYGILEMIANKFQSMPDGPHKLAIAVELFGRAGQELIPILNQGQAGLERFKGEAQSLGLVLDEAGVKRLEELHSKFVQLKGAVEGGGMAFTEALAPALEAIVTEFSNTTGGTNLWTAAGRQAGLVAIEVAAAFKWLADFVRESKDEYINLTNAINAFDYNIGSKFNWSQKYRDEEAARRDAAMKAMHDSKADHDAMLSEEANFVRDMKSVEQQLLHPTATPAEPSGPGGGGSGTGAGDGPGSGEGKGSSAQARALQAAQERAATAHRALVDALAKSDETRARAQVQTLLEINDELHKEGLRSEAEYLAQKSQLQEQQFSAERTQLSQEQRAILDQISQLEAHKPKNDKERLETQAKLNQLEVQYLGICDKVTDLEERQAKAAREIENAMANTRIALPDQMPDLGTIFQSKAPNVTLAKQPLFDPSQVEGEAEKFAHGVFDPLFQMGEKWDKQWKQIRENMLRDFGQLMESQLFGLLFGDPEGRGGKGWNGGSFKGDTSNPRSGLQNNAGGLIGGLLGLLTGKHAGVASNGGLGSGAGTVPSAAASLMQMGNKGGTSAGIQVVLNNNGAPLQVSQTQQQNDGGEGQVIQIMLKQLETNGPVAQGIMGMVGAL